jgi:hypothetical protein
MSKYVPKKAAKGVAWTSAKHGKLCGINRINGNACSCATHTGKTGSCRQMECTTPSSGKRAKGHAWDHWDHEGVEHERGRFGGGRGGATGKGDGSGGDGIFRPEI